jgi:outer membrane protein assembly factor BamB
MPIQSNQNLWWRILLVAMGGGHWLAPFSANAPSEQAGAKLTPPSNDVRSVAADHEHWNQYRGPRGDGSTMADLPLEFAEGSPQVLWKTAISGRAWSSPVVWEDRIWLTNAPEIQNAPGLSDFDAIPETLPPALDPPLKFSVVCLDAKSGEVLKDFPILDVTHPQFTHLTNSYASSTPVVEAGRLYAHYGSHGTVCVDTNTDQVLWRRTDIYCHHWRGAGSSPIVHGDLLYIAFDGYDHQFMIALNKHTGETVWQRNRDVDFGTDDGDAKKAYSTATIVEVDGRQLLVSPFASATTAYDALTGETVWTVHHSGMNAAARPIVGNGLVYIAAGDGRDTVLAIDPRIELPAGQDRIRWQLGRSTPKRPSPLLVGTALFMLEDKGVLSWINATTGEAITNDRVTGNYWASPLLAQDRIYCFSQEGRVTVLQANESLKVLAINQLDEGMNASPAVCGNRLILRTFKHVYCIGN